MEIKDTKQIGNFKMCIYIYVYIYTHTYTQAPNKQAC